MRANPAFAQDDEAAVRALVAEHPWATLVSHVPGRGLVASHYPVLLDDPVLLDHPALLDDTAGAGLTLVSHVGRPDEQLHELGRHEVMVVVEGVHGYVSPGWYGSGPAVPTWNFAVAHLYGTPELLGDADNLAVLDRLVARFERALPDPHLLDRSPAVADYAARIVAGTVGFRLRVTRFEAKEKMSQDKPAEVVDRIIGALRAPGPYANPALADRMTVVHAGAGAVR